jgi:signal transduction histidine kinase
MATCTMNLPMPFALLCAAEPKRAPLVAKGVLPDRVDVRHQRSALMPSVKAAERCGADIGLQHQRTTSALQAAGVGAWEHPLGDGTGFWSEHMYRLRGLSPDDPRPTRELAALVTDPADLETALRLQQRHVELGEPYVHEFRVRWPDGTERRLSSRGQLVRDGAGHPVGMAGVDFDITGQDGARGESLARSEFVASLSHELRTPLNAVIGFGQLLLQDPRNPPTPHQRRRLEHIRCAASHMLALINQTLDLASIEAAQQPLATGPVALADCAGEAMSWVEPAARASGVAVRAEGLEGCVLADARRLRQVVANLVSNAVKYNRPGGWVAVQTRRRMRHGAEQCALVVRDSGRGLTSDQIGRLFEPFNRLGAEREQIEGTGMGLAIARQLVHRMGGEMEVESQAGVGSEFTVWLPAAA